jgi:hypothetical protein
VTRGGERRRKDTLCSRFDCAFVIGHNTIVQEEKREREQIREDGRRQEETRTDENRRQETRYEKREEERRGVKRRRFETVVLKEIVRGQEGTRGERIEEQRIQEETRGNGRKWEAARRSGQEERRGEKKSQEEK